MANRILDAAARQERRIQGRKDAGTDLQGQPIGPSLEKLDETMAVSFADHFQFQTLQAHAHAGGRISPAEAMTVYTALGETRSSDNGGWQPHVTLPMKVVITQVMKELLGAR
tara:strand:+ start:728 stop:1063 length:336 start_codon:yes stop_codon:yes gene_type:complete